MLSLAHISRVDVVDLLSIRDLRCHDQLAVRLLRGGGLVQLGRELRRQKLLDTLWVSLLGHMWAKRRHNCQLGRSSTSAA